MNATERRLQAEWKLLRALERLNPHRLGDLSAEDREFSITLRDTPAPMIRGAGGTSSAHHLRILYPPHFPAVPLELYVAEAFRHPNVHPDTGFVCVWARHSVDNTAEHALHKVVAMMAGRLYNPEPIHVMQHDALSSMTESSTNELETMDVQPLIGVAHDTFALETPSMSQGLQRRRRLS